MAASSVPAASGTRSAEPLVEPCGSRGGASRVDIAAIPRGALLERYAAAGDYADCYVVTIPGHASLAEFVAAFYTTPLFKIERWLLATLLHFPSTDDEVRRLAVGECTRFAAWEVEARESDQVVLAAGRTRSWLMAASIDKGSEATALFFGSAVLQRRHGGRGWRFHALRGFHQLYSRLLLGSAARRLVASKRDAPHAA